MISWTASSRRPSTWKSANHWRGVLQEVGADVVGAGAVEVDRRTPRRPVAVGEVRTEGAEHVALGTEVVVDDVEDDGEAPVVAGVDEALQPGRAAVGVLHGEGEHAVVAPVAPPGNWATGMSSTALMPTSTSSSSAATAPSKVPSGRERPDVHLGDHVLPERPRPVAGVAPLVRAQVDHLRGPVHAVGLRPRRRVGEGPVAVEEVA